MSATAIMTRKTAHTGWRLSPDDKTKELAPLHQNHPSIPGGQSESIFKTCDMGVSGDFCFVHTNTTKMAAIITETVK